jgi:voltage-gated potassium channel
MYWAVVTLTTVGYGDVAPVTALGQMLAAIIMIMGYGIIAVPTGIVSVEIAHAARGQSGATEPEPEDEAPVTCPDCDLPGHDADALFCKRCGASLDTP